MDPQMFEFMKSMHTQIKGIQGELLANQARPNMQPVRTLLPAQGVQPKDGNSSHQQAHAVVLRSGIELDDPYKDHEYYNPVAPESVTKRTRDDMKGGDTSPPSSPTLKGGEPKKTRDEELDFMVEDMLYEEPPSSPKANIKEKDIEEPSTSSKDKGKAKVAENEEVDSSLRPNTKSFNVPLPFPQRGKAKEDVKFGKFVDMLKKMEISIPFTDVITQMPSYTKFLKDILNKKRNVIEDEYVALTEHCSAVWLNQMPKKLSDPGSFSIPCMVGNVKIDKALCDLGASVSLMPLGIAKRLKMGDLEPTSMSIQLADRSVKYPLGVFENVPVRIGKYYIPCDFVVLDMPEDTHTPIILGRPFLATAGADIKVRDGKLIFDVDGNLVVFKLSDSLKNPMIEEVCSIDVVDLACRESWVEKLEDEDMLNSMPCDYIEIEKVSEVSDVSPVIIPSERKLEKAPPQVELKPLPLSLKYAFLQGTNYPVIVNANLNDQELARLIEVLKTHQGALGYCIDDLKGINPLLCMHNIDLEEGSKPSREGQRRLNPHMTEVVTKEVMKLLDAGIIFPIANSKWVSPVQVVPKKGGITLIENEDGSTTSSKTITGWRMCIDYRKLNAATLKDHFPLPFIDQMLERLAKHEYFCFLDGYSGFFQIPIKTEDQEKTTFTCPIGTYAYRRMPFGLCNAPGTFQRCMMAIFAQYVGKSMEVFMDDFSVHGSSFDDCLDNLSNTLKTCEDHNLVLNWEKCHFMVREGIVLGHVISDKGIEVDKAKVEVIKKLPPPTNVRGVRSFLGHAGFYRRFIQDFSKITKPLTLLLAKDTPFVFDEICLSAFDRLKEALVSAPIVQPPDYSMPFEVMCNASDYAVGAVLGQRVDNKLHVVYY